MCRRTSIVRGPRLLYGLLKDERDRENLTVVCALVWLLLRLQRLGPPRVAGIGLLRKYQNVQSLEKEPSPSQSRSCTEYILQRAVFFPAIDLGYMYMTKGNARRLRRLPGGRVPH